MTRTCSPACSANVRSNRECRRTGPVGEAGAVGNGEPGGIAARLVLLAGVREPAAIRCRRAVAERLGTSATRAADNHDLGFSAGCAWARRRGRTPDLTASQLDAKRRFEDAIASAGPGLADILWRVVCAGEGMRDAETALGWPARAGKLVLTFALDRIAAYYRVR